MKTLSILDVLKKEYLGKELNLYIGKKKAWNNIKLMNFYFDEPIHLDSYLSTTVVITDIFCYEGYDSNTGCDYYIYNFRFEYEGELYIEQFLK